MRPSRLRELRLFLGMDQAEFARWFNTKQSVVSLWENGKRSPPLRQAAILFGASVDWLEGLSSQQWGERVLILGRAFRTHLLELNEQARRQLASAVPAGRIAHTCHWYQAEAPDLISYDLLARLAGLTPAALEGLLADRAAVPEHAFERLANYTGVAARWFTAGDFSVLEDPDMAEYSSLMQQLKADGITPADIRRVWSAIKSFR